MITSNYAITRVQIYKKLKNYNGEDVVEDLAWALYMKNLGILNPIKDDRTLYDIKLIKTLGTTGEEMDKCRRNAKNILRTFKTIKMKNKCKSKN